MDYEYLTIDDVPGVTSCPTCRSELDPIATDEAEPLQELTQACPGCSYETTQTMLWYPDGRFVIVDTTSSLSTPCDRCGDSFETAYVGIDNTTHSIDIYCADCCPTHFVTAACDN